MKKAKLTLKLKFNSCTNVLVSQYILTENKIPR